MLKHNTASFIIKAAATSSTSIVDYAISPCSPTVKMIGALANIMMYDDADLPWQGLMLQLASKKQACLKPPCL